MIPISMESNPKVKEEIILRNTFINAQLINADDETSLAIRSFDDTEDVRRKEKKKHIEWNLPQDKGGALDKTAKNDTSTQSKKQAERKSPSPKSAKVDSIPSHRRPFNGKGILKKNKRQDAEPSEESKLSNENEADENAIIINSATKRGAKTL